MKSKFFRILGVVTSVAMLAGMLTIAPAIGMSTPSVTLTAVGTGIAYEANSPNKYTISFTAQAAVNPLGKVVTVFPAGTKVSNIIYPSIDLTAGTYNLPWAAALDSAAIYVTSSATGAGETVTFVPGANMALASSLPAGATFVGGVLTFTLANQTAILSNTVAAAPAVGTLTKTGTPTGGGYSCKSTDVLIEALEGIPATSGFASNKPSYTISGTYPTSAQTLTITLPAAVAPNVNGIGNGSLCQITVGATTGVINPATAASYTFTVATNNGATPAVPIEAATTSTAYTIVAYAPPVAAGLVKVYSSTSTLIWQGTYQNTDIATALTKVSSGSTIELGPGEYKVTAAILTVPPVVGSTDCDNLTIKASGALADTKVKGNWTVNADNVNFKGITFMNDTTIGPTTVPAWTVFIIGAGADNVTFDGCAFAKYPTVAPATNLTAETFINYANASPNGKGTITNCAFDSTLDATNETNITVGAAAVGLTISKNTFKLDLNSTTYASDYAIDTTAVATAAGLANVTVTENTFTGTVNFGKAVKVSGGGLVKVTKNTFTGVMIALEAGVVATAGNAEFSGNTATGCGSASATTTTLNVPVFRVTNTGDLRVFNNKVTGSKWYVAQVTVGDAACHFNMNELSGNAYGFKNDAATVDLDATYNWWGQATGPATDHNSTKVDAVPFLTAAVSNGAYDRAVSAFDAKTTTGVIADSVDAAGAVNVLTAIGAANYAANPTTVAVPSTLTPTKYFDVFATCVWVAGDKVTIRFYGTVVANSEVWYYNALQSKWVKCDTQIANTSTGFVMVTITNITEPTVFQLGETPFVLVDAPLAAPVETAVVQKPALGAGDISVNSSFTWPAVAGAASYEFVVAEEDPAMPSRYAVPFDQGTPTVTAFKPIDALKYNTTYWWRVRAVNAAGVKGTWSEAFFTTEKAPAAVPEPTKPVEIIQQPAPEITLEIPAAEKVDVIPPYLIWAVIAVGAVLIIAVIVLIVRTRRIS